MPLNHRGMRDERVEHTMAARVRGGATGHTVPGNTD